MLTCTSKGRQGIPAYMPNQVTNSTEFFNCNFKCIFIAKLISPTCCMNPRVSLDGNKLSLRQVLGFLDKVKTLFYKRN